MASGPSMSLTLSNLSRRSSSSGSSGPGFQASTREMARYFFGWALLPFLRWGCMSRRLDGREEAVEPLLAWLREELHARPGLKSRGAKPRREDQVLLASSHSFA